MKGPDAALCKGQAERGVKSLEELKVYTLIPHFDVPQGQSVMF